MAYVVSVAQRTLTSDQLRDYLRERVPSHALPSAFVMLEALPLTPHGKLDRQALPPPDRAVHGEREPRTSAERALCDVFAEVLGLERVSVDDDFFLLGGHSLLAMKLVSRVRDRLDLELDSDDVFEAPRVEELASGCASRSRAVRCWSLNPVHTVSRPRTRNSDSGFLIGCGAEVPNTTSWMSGECAAASTQTRSETPSRRLWCGTRAFGRTSRKSRGNPSS